MTRRSRQLPDLARRLIVNADDFGRSPGINRGIIEAHLRGIVTSTTLMVNLLWSADAVADAASLRSLGVGLHLNFCYGPPLSTSVTSLIGADGKLDRDLARLRRRATAVDIDREARAQLSRFRELVGHDPTHLDSHQHIHAWPAAIEPVAVLAREIGAPVRACTTQHRETLRMLGVACPDAFVVDFYGEPNISSMTLGRILTALPRGTTELMCHPGFDDDAISDSSYRKEREVELRTLCAPEVREALDSEQIALASFRTS